MIELKLLKRDEMKAQLTLKLYQTTYDAIQRICHIEKIRMSDLLRHFCNKFIAEYETENPNFKKD